MFLTHRQTIGGQQAPEYKAWAAMKQRCFNRRHPQFVYYGARGITVCKRWIDSFEEFLRDVGRRPKGRVLDRRNNDRGYIPGNVRWVTRAVSNRNKRPPYTVKKRELTP